MSCYLKTRECEDINIPALYIVTLNDSLTERSAYIFPACDWKTGQWQSEVSFEWTRKNRKMNRMIDVFYRSRRLLHLCAKPEILACIWTPNNKTTSDGNIYLYQWLQCLDWLKAKLIVKPNVSQNSTLCLPLRYKVQKLVWPDSVGGLRLVSTISIRPALITCTWFLEIH